MTKPKTETKSLPPIPLPKDLKKGDVLVCNHGERVTFKMYDADGDICTSTTSDFFNTWKPNGRNYNFSTERWIVAIERKAETPAKPKESPTMNDPVNHPSHYTHGGIECIDAIRASLGDEGFIAFCRGNALKYLWRCEHKGNPIQDLGKAVWYINKAIEVMKGQSRG